MSDSEGKSTSAIGGKFVRFPVPAFDRQPLKGLSWPAPEFLDADAVADLVARQKTGDASAWGCYPVMPDDGFFQRLEVRGDHRHAILCVMPDTEVRAVGRSHAWFIQHAWIVDSLDAGSLNILADWKTPRPMNTRLGPRDGISLAGGIAYTVVAHAHGDHWDGNRAIMRNGEAEGDGRAGFRILSSSRRDSENFHDCNVDFSWAS